MNNESGVIGTRHGTPTKVNEELSKNVGQQQVFLALRVINFLALGALALVLVPAVTIRSSQLVFVLPILAFLVGFYWVSQNNPTVSAIYLGLSLALFLWIIVCENIVSIDNALGTRITAQLQLGIRLKAFAKANLKHQDKFRETCCDDPLSYHYKPGTTYREIYDCVKCNEPHEVLVDTTGYLNRQYDLTEDGRQVDMFIAGDSVLEGLGIPSIVEFLNELVPLKIWSLSSSNYGPRQKASALMAYALPLHPKWIVIDFFSANDIRDATISEVCESTGTFHCLFNVTERHRALLNHPVFSPMVDKSQHPRGAFDDYAENSFTLAVTRYLVGGIKAAIKGMATNSPRDNENQRIEGTQTTRLSVSDVPPPWGKLGILPEQRFEWLKEGMRLTYIQYDRLSEKISKMQQPPAVILLYNPSVYEIYREILVDSDREMDRVSELQKQAIRHYADQKGWRFVDLAMPLRDELKQSRFWIYGEFDRVHWSTDGTKMVASVLAREFTRIIYKCSLMPSVPTPNLSTC